MIPFEYRDGLIWVKVKVAGAETPLNFLLDSGAGASVLSLDAARRLGVKMAGATRVQRVNAGAVAYRVQQFRGSMGGIALAESPLALDLRSTSALCSRPIDGLVGQDFFRNRIVQIDFKASRIRLLDRPENARGSVVPLKLHRDVMCIAASVNGSAQRWVRLDTGCDDGLHWVGTTPAGRQLKTSVRLGEERVGQVDTKMHAQELFPDEAGLLGNAVLSNYVVTIDAVQKRLLLARG